MTVPDGIDARLGSDAELITRVRAGDRSAFGELYRRHSAAASGLARQFARTPAEVDDLVSESFARVLDGLTSGGGPDTAFRAYLFTTLRHTAYDRTRKDRRLEFTDDLTPHEKPEVVPDPVIAMAESGMVGKAFASLPERWQAVLWHTQVEGQSPAEVGVLMGMSANAVTSLAFRAREGLREAYLQAHLADTAAEQCRATTERLGAWARGGLSRREQAAVDAHLATCDDCRAVAAELVEVNSSLRGLLAPLLLGAAAVGYLALGPLEIAGTATAAAFATGSGVAAGAEGGAAAATAGGSGGSGALAEFFAKPWAVGAGAVAAAAAVVVAVVIAVSGSSSPDLADGTGGSTAAVTSAGPGSTGGTGGGGGTGGTGGAGGTEGTGTTGTAGGTGTSGAPGTGGTGATGDPSGPTGSGQPGGTDGADPGLPGVLIPPGLIDPFPDGIPGLPTEPGTDPGGSGPGAPPPVPTALAPTATAPTAPGTVDPLAPSTPGTPAPTTPPVSSPSAPSTPTPPPTTTPTPPTTPAPTTPTTPAPTTPTTPTTPLPADVSISVQAALAALSGGSASTSVVIENSGGVASAAGSVSIATPPGVSVSGFGTGQPLRSFGALRAAPAGCTEVNPTVTTCQLPGIAPGTTLIATLTLGIDEDAAAGTVDLTLPGIAPVSMALTINPRIVGLTVPLPLPVDVREGTTVSVGLTATMSAGVDDPGTVRIPVRSGTLWVTGYPSTCVPSAGTLRCTAQSIEGLLASYGPFQVSALPGAFGSSDELVASVPHGGTTVLLSASATVGTEDGNLDLVGSLGATTVAAPIVECFEGERETCKSVPTDPADRRRTLTVPAGATVAWAGLSWVTGGKEDVGAVTLTVDGVPHGVDADVNSCSGPACPHARFADVSDLFGGSASVDVVMATDGSGGATLPLAGWALTVVYLLPEGPATQVTFDPSLAYSSPGTTVEVAGPGDPITALDVVAWAADPVGTKSLVATAGSTEPYVLTTDIDGMVERVRNGKVVSVGAGIDLLAFSSNSEGGLPTDATGSVSFVNRNADRVGDGLFVGPTLVVRMVPPDGPPSS